MLSKNAKSVKTKRVQFPEKLKGYNFQVWY